MLLVLEMKHVELLFGFLELPLEPGDLLLVGLFALLQLNLKQSELLHGFLDALLVFVQHAIGSSIFRLKGFVDILKFNDFFLEVLESGLEIVSLPLDQI